MRRRILLNSSVIDPTTGRGTIGDYEVVDLGLPSGLLWATWNVGATKETGYGNYYQWGTGAITYKNEIQYHTGGTDSGYTLPSSADTATQVMGSEWRMPTADELRELINNTNYEWLYKNGCKLTSKTNPNAYVFFPAAGFYDDGSQSLDQYQFHLWSSTAYATYQAYRLDCNSSYVNCNDAARIRGFSIRGVHAAI